VIDPLGKTIKSGESVTELGSSTAPTNSNTTDPKRDDIKERNRYSAMRSRNRKKEHYDKLEKDCKKLSIENTILRQEVIKLKKVLQDHVNCDVTLANYEQSTIRSLIEPHLMMSVASQQCDKIKLPLTVPQDCSRTEVGTSGAQPEAITQLSTVVPKDNSTQLQVEEITYIHSSNLRPGEQFFIHAKEDRVRAERGSPTLSQVIRHVAPSSEAADLNQLELRQPAGLSLIGLHQQPVDNSSMDQHVVGVSEAIQALPMTHIVQHCDGAVPPDYADSSTASAISTGQLPPFVVASSSSGDESNVPMTDTDHKVEFIGVNNTSRLVIEEQGQGGQGDDLDDLSPSRRSVEKINLTEEIRSPPQNFPEDLTTARHGDELQRGVTAEHSMEKRIVMRSVKSRNQQIITGKKMKKSAARTLADKLVELKRKMSEDKETDNFLNSCRSIDGAPIT